MPTIVRFLDGSMVCFEASDTSEFHTQVCEYVRNNLGDNVWVELIPSNTSSDTTYYDYCALIHPSRVVMILNRTQGNYISIETDELGNSHYTDVMKDMFGWDEDFFRFFPGHWVATDHIVFVPDHLHTYVSYAYAKLFL